LNFDESESNHDAEEEAVGAKEEMQREKQKATTRYCEGGKGVDAEEKEKRKAIGNRIRDAGLIHLYSTFLLWEPLLLHKPGLKSPQSLHLQL
jgi:hypothetical protein